MVFAEEKHTGAGTYGRSKQAQTDEKSRRQAWNTRTGTNALSMGVWDLNQYLPSFLSTPHSAGLEPINHHCILPTSLRTPRQSYFLLLSHRAGIPDRTTIPIVTSDTLDVVGDPLPRICTPLSTRMGLRSLWSMSLDAVQHFGPIAFSPN